MDINDRVHSESVKCYRNIKGVLAEYQEELLEAKNADAAKETKKPFRGLRFFAAFAFIDFIVLVLYILYTMGLLNGIISYFM